MQERNVAWQERFALHGRPFHWDLESATIAFQRDHDDVLAALCVVGTTSNTEGTIGFCCSRFRDAPAVNSAMRWLVCLTSSFEPRALAAGTWCISGFMR
jgi:hypothetical protein